MLKTKLSGLICYELSSQIEKIFEIKIMVVDNGGHTDLKHSEDLTESVIIEVQKYINAFEDGLNALTTVLNEIQEHAELITSKINQI